MTLRTICAALGALLLLTAPAQAQDAPAEDAPASEAPASDAPPAGAPAVPPPTPSQPPPVRARGDERPPEAPPPAPRLDKTAALMEYANLHLEVRAQRHYEGGDAVRVTRYYGWPFIPFVAVGTSYVVYEPVREYKTWAVYQGGTKVTVPTYLDLVGREGEANALRGRILSMKVGSGVLLGVAAGAATTSLVGTLAYVTARTRQERGGGAAAAIAGGVGALLSAGVSLALVSEARRLRWDFTSSFDDGVQPAVRAHNEALRTKLGLTQTDVRVISGK